MTDALKVLAVMIVWLYVYAGYHVVKDVLRQRRARRLTGGQR